MNRRTDRGTDRESDRETDRQTEKLRLQSKNSGLGLEHLASFNVITADRQTDT